MKVAEDPAQHVTRGGYGTTTATGQNQTLLHFFQCFFLLEFDKEWNYLYNEDTQPSAPPIQSVLIVIGTLNRWDIYAKKNVRTLETAVRGSPDCSHHTNVHKCLCFENAPASARWDLDVWISQNVVLELNWHGRGHNLIRTDPMNGAKPERVRDGWVECECSQMVIVPNSQKHAHVDNSHKFRQKGFSENAFGGTQKFQNDLLPRPQQPAHIVF